MTDSGHRVLEARATLEVAELAAALGYWSDVVGFDVHTTMGEPPTFALVGAGEVGLALVQVASPALPDGAACYITLADLDGFVAATEAAGVPPEAPPQTWPWGMRDVVVRCPGGGPRIAFGERLG